MHVVGSVDQDMAGESKKSPSKTAGVTMRQPRPVFCWETVIAVDVLQLSGVVTLSDFLADDECLGESKVTRHPFVTRRYITTPFARARRDNQMRRSR